MLQPLRPIVRLDFRFVGSTLRSIRVRMRRRKPLCLWPDLLSEVLPNIIIGEMVLYMANGLLLGELVPLRGFRVTVPERYMYPAHVGSHTKRV